MHHQCQKYSKVLKNDQNAPKTTLTTPKTFRMTKIPLNPQNTQNFLETSENIPKLSQNTLDFLDFGCILVSFKLFCSFQRILRHFANFSSVEVYTLIILDVSGILAVYEVSRFDCSF